MAWSTSLLLILRVPRMLNRHALVEPNGHSPQELVEAIRILRTEAAIDRQSSGGIGEKRGPIERPRKQISTCHPLIRMRQKITRHPH